METSEQSHKPRSTITKSLLIVGGLVVLISILLVVVFFRNRPERQTGAPTPTAPTAQVPSGAHGAPDPQAPAIEQITIESAKALYDEQKVLFIDLRVGSEFDKLHITDAATITSADLEPRLQGLAPDMVIITYAAQADEAKSVRGAQIFKDMGYGNVMALQGGFEAWQKAKYPTTSER